MAIRNRKSFSGPARPTLFMVLGLLALAAAPLAAQTGNKLGTIDVQKILLESAPGVAVLEDLKQYRADKESELAAADAELKELQEKFAQGRLTLAEDRLADMQKEIEDKAIKLKRDQDDANREFQVKQQEKFAEVEKAVLPIIQQVGEELGFTMIFNRYQSGLVFSDDAIDITAAVIERYNSSSAGAGSGD